MHIDYALTVGAFCSPAGLDNILLANLMLYNRSFEQMHQCYCGSHSSIMVCQNMFNHVVLLINSQVADIIAQWAVLANVPRLVTPVA
jgi:hypothetical protein